MLSTGAGASERAAAIADVTAPAPVAVSIESSPPDGRDAYRIGEIISVRLTFDEPVAVDKTAGSPSLALTIGDRERRAVYSSGSDTRHLVFRYRVADGDADADGVAAPAGALALNEGTIADATDNAAILTTPAVPDQPGQRVDGERPNLVAAVAVAGREVSLAFDEPLDEGSIPALDAFAVIGEESAYSVTSVAVEGASVWLALSASVPEAEAFVSVSYRQPVDASARSIRDTLGNAAASFVSDWYAQQPEALDRASRAARAPRVGEKQRIGDILGKKALRTPAERKVSSRLLEVQRRRGEPPKPAVDGEMRDERVMVDIRVDVTPEVLKRIRALGGEILDRQPRYRSIRARLTPEAAVALAELDAVQTIRPADEGRTRQKTDTGSGLPALANQVVTSAGDTVHRAASVRTTHGVAGTGIGVIPDGVDTLAEWQASGELPGRVTVLPGQAGRGDEGTQPVRQIEALLAAKAQRTPAQRKVSSQLLDASGSGRPSGPAGSIRPRATDPDALPERVTVDIRADVTPAVLRRIRALGGTVINSVPKYRAIRAELPLAAVVRLAALSAVQSIRPADEAVTRQDDTTEGDVAHRANQARRTHGVDGTGIGIGVISDGVRSLADRQATDDLPARVTVLPGQAGRGDEGTALLEIVHDLAPGAELYFATGHGGQAQMAENIEALCEAGANVIVDDIGYPLEAAFQDDIVSKGVNAAVTDGCYFFSAGGNDGNLTYGTTGAWEGDYAAGSTLVVDGETLGVRHDFGGGVEANEVSSPGFGGVSAIVLQWADPLGASANDYDLFLVNEDGDVIASSTDTQDGTQDPIESIFSPFFNFSGLRLVVVKTSGSDRYLRVHAFDGRLAIQTAGNMYGHPAAENAIGVAMVDVRGAGPGDVFNGNESVRRGNSDGPRRMFFEPDGAAITAGNFSSTGGELLQKPDLAAATCVTTATPGFSTFCGTSAAAPHAAAIGALMLEAAGGPNEVTLARLRTGNDVRDRGPGHRGCGRLGS